MARRGGAAANAIVAAVFVAVLAAGCAGTTGPATGIIARGGAGAAPTLDGVDATPVPHGGALEPAACIASPLGDRALYLRGTFNSWGTPESSKFGYVCNRFELVTRLTGTQTFKLGDEDWSADADFGASALVRPGQALPLQPRGRGITYTFNGTHRIVMTPSTPPAITIEDCPAAAPLGQTTLFLRGSMNNWGALDEHAFQYGCDAYYLNVHLSGPHNFKIADAAWTPISTFGATLGGRSTPAFDHALPLARASEPGSVADLAFGFDGEQTIRLAFHGNEPRITIGARSFADPLARPVTDPVALGLRHDSRDAADKSPFGAVPAGTTVHFGLDAPPGVTGVTLVIERRRLEGNQELLEYTEQVRVTMTRGAATAGGSTERWSANHRFDDIAVYGYWFEALIAGKTWVYQNNADAVYWTREKGSGGVGTVAEKPDNTRRIRRYRLTVYDPNYQVPDWAQDAVFYYIFPDRFRNGDPSNDPMPGVQRYHDHPIEFHANWLDKPSRPGAGDGSDGVYNNDFFGGDIAGIIDKLGDIAELGANTLYITPLFKAASNHKYDTADYHSIDPGFGSNDDFTRLTREAARRGMRVIIDASLNHTGADSIYFDRYANHHAGGAFEGGRIRPNSPYASWYRFDATQRDPDKQYQGWVGVHALPELDKSAPAWREFAYRARDSVTRTWLERGAAGWRMDVAPWVPDDFWREWRTVVKRARPDALTVAETWFDASKFFLGDTFDSTMNYIFRNTVLDYAAGGNAAALYRNIELMREAYPPQSFHALMNLLSSHDQPRALHVLGWDDDTAQPADAATIALAKQRLRLAVLFQMTFPGAPSVYYGDEVGVTGGDDPYNRRPYPWADLGGAPDTALRAEFKRLIKLRRDHAVLRRGSLGAPLHADAHVIVLARRLGDAWALTATNNAASARSVSISLPPGAPATYTDALTGAAVTVSNRRLTLSVPALFGTVLVSR